MKFKLPSYCNSDILLLLNKDKTSELRNSEVLFSLKIFNEKLAMTSQFGLTRFYDVIMRNSVFLTQFSSSGIPDPVFKS